jgi:hypothetical protein
MRSALPRCQRHACPNGRLALLRMWLWVKQRPGNSTVTSRLSRKR